MVTIIAYRNLATKPYPAVPSSTLYNFPFPDGVPWERAIGVGTPIAACYQITLPLVLFDANVGLSANDNNLLVHWFLMVGLSRYVQRWENWT